MSSQKEAQEEAPVTQAQRNEIIQFMQTKLECTCLEQFFPPLHNLTYFWQIFAFICHTTAYYEDPKSSILRERILKVESRAFKASKTKHDYLVAISNTIKAVEKIVRERSDLNIERTDASGWRGNQEQSAWNWSWPQNSNRVVELEGYGRLWAAFASF